LYSSPNVIRTIKSKIIRLAGHIAPMGKRETHVGFGGKARRKETVRKT
jgi:hypothetical protein